MLCYFCCLRSLVAIYFQSWGCLCVGRAASRGLAVGAQAAGWCPGDTNISGVPVADECGRSCPWVGSALRRVNPCFPRGTGSGACPGHGWSCPTKELGTPALWPFHGRIWPLHALPLALRVWLAARRCASRGTDSAPAPAVLPSLCPAGISPCQSWMWHPEPRLPVRERDAGGTGILPWDEAMSQRGSSGFCWWEPRPQDSPKGKPRGREHRVAVSVSHPGGWSVPCRDGHHPAPARGRFNGGVKVLSRAGLFLRAAPNVS